MIAVHNRVFNQVRKLFRYPRSIGRTVMIPHLRDPLNEITGTHRSELAPDPDKSNGTKMLSLLTQMYQLPSMPKNFVSSDLDQTPALVLT